MQSYRLFRMAIHPSYDHDQVLIDQIGLLKYLNEKEDYQFVNYSDLIKII